MTELQKVIAEIKNAMEGRFRFIDNTGFDKKIVGGQFPDILLLQNEPPPNNNILFVLTIETDPNLVDSVSEWKALGSGPSGLYIIVPKERLDVAKKLANATDVNARFGWYEMENGEVTEVHYE